MKQLRDFLLIVVLLSAPLWLAAAFLDATKIIPVRLPLSALQFISVLLAAVIVTHRSGQSVRTLLKRGLDFTRIRNDRWRVGIFVLMPIIVLLSFGVTLITGGAVSTRWTPVAATPVFRAIAIQQRNSRHTSLPRCARPEPPSEVRCATCERPPN